MGRVFFSPPFPSSERGGGGGTWWLVTMALAVRGGQGMEMVGAVAGRGGGGGKGFTALLGGDQFMGIQPGARYSLNASSGGMQRHQLECVRR